MSINTAGPEQVRELLKAHLESFEQLSIVTILKGSPKEIGPMIDEALAKLGLCAVIAPAKAGTSNINLPGPILDKTLFVIRIYENPEFDGNTETAFDVAYFIATHCHGVDLDETRNVLMKCDADTITLGADVGNEEQPCISYDVPIWIRVPPASDWQRVATPVIIYGEDGRVQMTCATPGAAIFYTTNDKMPTSSSTYGNGITSGIEDPATIKAKAFLAGFLPSAVATAAPGEIEDTTVTLVQINAALADVNSPMRYSSTGVPLIKGTDGKWTPIIVTVGPEPDNDRSVVAGQEATDNIP